MSENVILRTTKMGQKGFVIEDVNQYLDELNDKIVSLEKQLADANQENENLKKALEGKGVEIPSESKVELAEAKSEIERLKSQLEMHKNQSGGLNGARSADTIKLEAELKNIKADNERLKKQVEFARQKLAGNNVDDSALQFSNPQTEAELAEAKAEIEKLRNQMNIAKQRMEEIKAKFVGSNPAEVNALKSEINSKNQEIKSLEKELDELKAVVGEKESEIEKIKSESEAEIAKITKEKDAEIENAKASATPGAMFDSIIKVANEQAETIKKEAAESIEKNKAESEKILEDAKAEADKIINDAKAEAENTISIANTTADSYIREANEKADLTRKQANEQAEHTIANANKESDRINSITDSVRSMLRNEIEDVSSKLEFMSGAVDKIISQTHDRLKEANIAVEEAKKSLNAETSDDNNAKSETVNKNSDKKENNVSDFMPEPEKAPEPKQEKNIKKPVNFAFDMAELVKAAEMEAVNNPEPEQEIPAPAKHEPTPKEKQAKKINNFNFDMAELVKAAEEDASRNPQE